MSNDEQQRSRQHDTLGEMSDVEQQRSRSAVDLRKSSTTCRYTISTQLNSTSSDNVLPEVFQIVRAENPRLPVDFKRRAQAELFAVVLLITVLQGTCKPGAQAGMQ